MSLLGKARELEKTLEQSRETDVPEDVYAAIGYDPRPLQNELDWLDERFNVRVLHRRFGKTVREVAKLVERAVECPYEDGRYAYFAPTYTQAKDIAWLYLQRFHEKLCEACGLDPQQYRHTGELHVTVPRRAGGWSRIRLYGLDTPKQRIRGLYLDGAVFDEFAWIPWSAWSEQVRPMLSDDVRAGEDRYGRRNQWADFIFTPLGRNHAYTLFRKAQLWASGEAVKEVDPDTGEEFEVRSDEWHAAIYRASETGILTKRELTASFYEMGRNRYLQEFECSFDAAIEGAIYASYVEEAREQGRVIRLPVEPLLPVNTAWDLGWDGATAIWFFQRRGEEVRVVDFLEVTNLGLERIVEKLAERDYRYGYHLLPWDVEIGELGTGKDRASVLRELGVRVTTVPRSPRDPHDRIAAAQALFPLCWFDASRCAEGLDRLAQYRREYDERNDKLRDKPRGDWASHAADAFGILARGVRRPRGPEAPDPRTTTHAVLE